MQAVTNAVRGACETLLVSYPRYIRAASTYTSPNPEDDEWVRLGIAAFSSYASTELWERPELEYFCHMRSEEFTAGVLAGLGDEALPYERFGCLCIGAILGLRRMGAIQSEDELTVAHGIAMQFMTIRSQDIAQLEQP